MSTDLTDHNRYGRNDAKVGTNLQVRPHSVDRDADPEGRKHPRSRRPRLSAFDYKGRLVYHATFGTHARSPLLIDDFAKAVCAEVEVAAAATGFDALAYCVMPDHCHALLQGQNEQSRLLTFVKRFKQKTSFAARSLTNGKPLWQQSFHDRILRKSENATEVARYILENPEREGLVESGSEWPFSGGLLLSVRRDGPEGSSLLSTP